MSLEDVVEKLRKKILGFRDRKELIVEEDTKGALIEPGICERFCQRVP